MKPETMTAAQKEEKAAHSQGRHHGMYRLRRAYTPPKPYPAAHSRHESQQTTSPPRGRPHAGINIPTPESVERGREPIQATMAPKTPSVDDKPDEILSMLRNNFVNSGRKTAGRPTTGPIVLSPCARQGNRTDRDSQDSHQSVTEARTNISILRWTRRTRQVHAGSICSICSICSTSGNKKLHRDRGSSHRIYEIMR